MNKKILFVFIGSILIFILYHFLFGRLFPWSPLKLGYKHVQYSKAVVILPRASELPEEFASLEDIFIETEQFHQLQFKKPVKIILPSTHAQYTGFSGVQALACALQSGTVAFLSPDIPKKGRSRIDLLKHELSHILLFQHAEGMLTPFKIPEWFREGLAIYYGNPHDNYVGEAFLKAAVDDGYFFDVLNAEEEITRIPLEQRYRFLHSEYRCFMEYLVERFGMENIIRYMKDVIRKPEQEHSLFYQTFGVELKEAVENFKQDVLSKKWPS